MTDQKRTYTSPLREELARMTRENILEAALRLLAEGASALTVPAVAKEAGVAVPTVYRHFQSKEALESGVAEHVRTLTGVKTEPSAAGAGLEQYLGSFKDIIERFEALPEGALVMLMADVGRRVPKEGAQACIDMVRDVIAPDIEGLSAEDAERLTKVTAALCSSPATVAFRRLGLGWDESISLISWVLRTLHAALPRQST
jgi:AcrR family transcriptional regulator